MKDSEAFDFNGRYGSDYRDFVQRVIPAYDAFFQVSLALLQTDLPTAARLLVVGCGSGKELNTFGPACPQWRFTAVDPSQQMIETATAAVTTTGIGDRVDFHHGYADGLEAAPVFDAATLINVMHFLPDDGAKQALVESIACRLKPGGSLILFDLHGDPTAPAFARLLKAWEQFMVLQGFNAEERDTFLRRLDTGIDYIPEARVIEIADLAGLALEQRFFAGLLYGGWSFRKKD
jgi:tRNA (cmo5U34)-methyltransferase